MRVGLIYGLHDPFTEELRYVGQTWCSLGRRLSQHVALSKSKTNRHVLSWISSLLEKGGRPIIRELGRADTVEELDALEVKTISEAKLRGDRLTNHAVGGKGRKGSPSPRKGVRLSEEVKAKISRSRKGQATFTGKKHSDHTKAVISGKQKGNKYRLRGDVTTEDLLFRLSEGVSATVVAREFGVSRSTVKKRVGNLPGRSVSISAILHELGDTPSKSVVAAKLGISESTVYKKLARAGIQLPKCRPGPKPRVAHG